MLTEKAIRDIKSGTRMPQRTDKYLPPASGPAKNFLALCLISLLGAGLAAWHLWHTDQGYGLIIWLGLTIGLCLFGAYIAARVWWLLSEYRH